MFNINSDLFHDEILKNKPKFSFDRKGDVLLQRKMLREKFISILGIDEIAKNDCEMQYEIIESVVKDGYTRYKIHYYSEKDCVVPCYLLIPNDGKDKHPLAICVAGHLERGYLMYVGEGNYDNSFPEDMVKRTSVAVQAVKNGFCALAIEQRGMASQYTDKEKRKQIHKSYCGFNAFQGIAIGRTLIGERCWDVKKGIDYMEKFFPQVDTTKIVMTGGSGGGTASYYSAAFDERITISAPCVAFCSFDKSILEVNHCPCNYIPNSFNYFDMQDLSLLIAPRHLIITNGKLDLVFLPDGVKKGFETVKEIYSAFGAEDNIELIMTEYGHKWAPEIVWGAINKKIKKLNW